MRFRFSGSEFHTLYQPSYCPKRVWLLANRPHLAADDSDFQDLLLKRGALLEERHLRTLGRYESPQYARGDWASGARATADLIASKVSIIYQPVLVTPDGLWGIPDLLLLDRQTGRYRLRDVKLATNLDAHREIMLQVGLYRMAATSILGYQPETEIVTGGGAITRIESASNDEVLDTIRQIDCLRNMAFEPWEPVGWSKCEACVFRAECWDRAVDALDVATVPYVDQGACRALRDMGIVQHQQLDEFSEELLGQLERPWGARTQRVGKSAARKIKNQVKALVKREPIVTCPLPLPPGFTAGQRPVVMFDIENDVFDLDLGVKVYLWGCLLAKTAGRPDVELVIAGKGVEGDWQGWLDFLDYASHVFAQHGDVPFVHYSPHEKTWVTKYIERYGDRHGTAERVLANLWDMHPAITNSLFLPVPSYGLKNIEKLVGFRRSQQEYGGLWSIVTYDKYVSAATETEGQRILDLIRVYNTEDLLASLAIYEWLEGLSRTRC